MTFNGADIDAMDQSGLYAVRRQMGMLFQFGALFTDLSVFDNVAFPLREHTDLPDSMIRDLVLMKLNAVGLRGAQRPDAGADFRRHGAARGPGPRHRAGPGTDDV